HRCAYRPESLPSAHQTNQPLCHDLGMRVDEHIARVRAEGDRLVELLRVADLGATTPTCPEWTVAELARHTGRIHRWAATVVRSACDHEPSSDEQEAWWGVMPA